MNTSQSRLIALFNFYMIAVLLAACVPATPSPTATPIPVEVQARPAFAAFIAQPVDVIVAIDQEPIDPAMENVLVPLALSLQQLERLALSGVVASPREYEEFSDLYRETRWANLPIFVTSDSLLHSYHLIFDKSLRTIEEQVFLPKLQAFNQRLFAQADAQYTALKGTPWEDAARRVVAYVAVAGKLADDGFIVPASVAALVEAELAAMDAAQPAASAIFPLLKFGEDYSQYIPRGHYTKSDALQSYFKAMMWYGRMTFRLDDPDDPNVGPTETRMALLLTLAVRDADLLSAWDELYAPTAFLVGRSDDLTFQDYLAAIEAVYGPAAPLTAVANDARLADFISATANLPAPRILGLISADYKPVAATKGLRLMGQRFVPDAYIFQELIHPKVPGRLLPSGLDVMGVLGSERARTWLEEDPSTQKPEYASQFQMLTTWVNGLSTAEWTETSTNGWLYTLRPLLTPPGQGYPVFMQSTAWQDKQLNTALGSWAELKHDTLLYAKQAYGGLGGGGEGPYPPVPLPAQNYVEPVPEVFARLAALSDMTRAGLEQRGLLENLREAQLGPKFDELSQMALSFKAMAEKELRAEALSEDEQKLIREYESYLRQLVEWSSDFSETDPAAIIADVATDPNTGQVLEVGVGTVHELYVVAPIAQADGSLALTVARGGVFSYYEFPSTTRLTDQAWREQVKAGTVPAQPAFTGGFSVPQAADSAIQAAVYGFQHDWIRLMFYSGADRGIDYIEYPFTVMIQPQARAAAAALETAKQYEGRQWITTDYLTVERLSDTLVIVNVRETWQDYLAQYQGDDPFAWYTNKLPEPIIGRRGPYTIDVRYTLEGSSDSTWRVTGFEELTPRPEWEAP